MLEGVRKQLRVSGKNHLKSSFQVCVLDVVYDDDNPLYYYESLWLENKIRPAIRACSADPDLDKFLNY